MKQKLIITLLPALFALFAAIGFTACSSDDGGYKLPAPSLLEKYYFRVKKGTHINDFFPDPTCEEAIASIAPKNIDLLAGKSITLEIAVDKDIKLDKFCIGVENISSTNTVSGYYEVVAKKEKEGFASFYKYKVTIDFPDNAKSNFLIKIAGAATNKEGARMVTKTSKIPVHLTPVVPENVIVGKWDKLQKKDSATPEPNNLLFVFGDNKNGYVQNYLENETTNFIYAYSPKDDNLVITFKEEIINCTIKFSADQDTMFITENYRFNTKNEDMTIPDTPVEYTLTRIYE